MSSIDNLKNEQPAAPIKITDPNIQHGAVKLGDFIDESDEEKKKRKALLDSIDAKGAEVLPNGEKIIDPSMIPNLKTEEDDTKSIEEETMDTLHDVITRKQQEAREELEMFMAESEINEKMIAERNLQINGEGNVVESDGTVAERTEDEDLEAELDKEIAMAENVEGKVVLPDNIDNIPGAPMSDPSYETHVSDDEFDKMMSDMDNAVESGKVKEVKHEEEENVEAQEKEINTEHSEEEKPQEVVASEQQKDNNKIVEMKSKEDENEDAADESDDEEQEAEKKAAPTLDSYTTRFNPNSIDLEEELIKDANEDDESASVDLAEEESEKEFEELKQGTTKAMNLAPARIDLSGFTEKPPISASSIIKSIVSGKATDSTDWVLSNSKMPITMRKFTGVELKALAAYSTSRRSRVNSIYERFQMIYDHDMNPYKPSKLEDWAKTISANDDDDLYFAIYDATFHNANHIPYVCDNPDCQHAFISEHIPTSEMVKISDEFKAEFESIRNQGPSVTPNRIHSKKIVPISDHIGIAVKNATLYDVNFIYRLVGPDFYRKYQDTMDVIGYIEDMYYIDAESKTLQKIACKTGKDSDVVKNIKNRIITYNRIITELTPDQYSLIMAAATSEDDTTKKKIKYVIPQVVCPKCGKVIKEIPLDGVGDNPTVEAQLFTRQPLAQMTNI